VQTDSYKRLFRVIRAHSPTAAQRLLTSRERRDEQQVIAFFDSFAQELFFQWTFEVRD